MTDADVAVAVLDASALIAFVYEEKGAHRVEPILRRGALISTVNWAEALSIMAERDEPVERSVPRVTDAVADVGALHIVAYDEAQAVETARLRLRTTSLGLSLADRSCLALGRLRRLPVFTTDRAWRSLHVLVKIEIIR